MQIKSKLLPNRFFDPAFGLLRMTTSVISTGIRPIWPNGVEKSGLTPVQFLSPFIFFVVQRKRSKRKDGPNPSPGASTVRCAVFSKLVPMLGTQTAEKTAAPLTCRSIGSGFRAPKNHRGRPDWQPCEGSEPSQGFPSQRGTDLSL